VHKTTGQEGYADQSIHVPVMECISGAKRKERSEDENVETHLLPFEEALAFLSEVCPYSNSDLIRVLVPAIRSTMDKFGKRISESWSQVSKMTRQTIVKMEKELKRHQETSSGLEAMAEQLRKKRDYFSPGGDSGDIHWAEEYVQLLCHITRERRDLCRKVAELEECITEFVTRKRQQMDQYRDIHRKMLESIEVNISTLDDEHQVMGIEQKRLLIVTCPSGPRKKQKKNNAADIGDRSLKRYHKFITTIDPADPYNGKEDVVTDLERSVLDLQADWLSSSSVNEWLKSFSALGSLNDMSPHLRKLICGNRVFFTQMLELMASPDPASSIWNSDHMDAYRNSDFHKADLYIIQDQCCGMVDTEQPRVSLQFISKEELTRRTIYDESASPDRLFGYHSHGGDLSRLIREDLSLSNITLFTLVDMRLQATRRAVESYLQLCKKHHDQGGDNLAFAPLDVKVCKLTPLHWIIQTTHDTDPSRITANHCLGALLTSHNFCRRGTEAPFPQSLHGGHLNFHVGHLRDRPKVLLEEDAKTDIRTIIETMCPTSIGFDPLSRMETLDGEEEFVTLGTTVSSWISGLVSTNPEMPMIRDQLDIRYTSLHRLIVEEKPTEEHFIFKHEDEEYEILYREEYVTKLVTSSCEYEPIQPSPLEELVRWTATPIVPDAMAGTDMESQIVEFIGMSDNHEVEIIRHRDNSVYLSATYLGAPVLFPIAMTLEDLAHLSDSGALTSNESSIVSQVDQAQSVPSEREITAPSVEEVESLQTQYIDRILDEVPSSCMWKSVDESGTALVHYASITPRGSLQHADRALSPTAVDIIKQSPTLYHEWNVTEAFVGISVSTTPVMHTIILSTQPTYPTDAVDTDAVNTLQGMCLEADGMTTSIMGIIRLLLAIEKHNGDAIRMLPSNFLSHCIWDIYVGRFRVDLLAAWLSNESELTVGDLAASTGIPVLCYILQTICKQVRDLCAVMYQTDGPSSCMNYGDIEFCRLFGAITTCSGASTEEFLTRILSSRSLLLANFPTRARSVLWSSVMPAYYDSIRNLPPRKSRPWKTTKVPAQFAQLIDSSSTSWMEDSKTYEHLCQFLCNADSQYYNIRGSDSFFNEQFSVDYTTMFQGLDDNIRSKYVGVSSGIGVSRAVYTGLMAAANKMLLERTDGTLTNPITMEPLSGEACATFFRFLVDTHLQREVTANVAIDPIIFERFSQSASYRTKYVKALTKKSLAGLIINTPCNDGRKDEKIAQASLTNPEQYLDPIPDSLSTTYMEESAWGSVISKGEAHILEKHAGDMHKDDYSKSHLSILTSMPPYLMHRMLCCSYKPMTYDELLPLLRFKNYFSGTPEIIKRWLKSLSEEELGRFCHFVSGSRTIRPGSEVVVERMRKAKWGSMISVMTCTRDIRIPDYVRIFCKKKLIDMETIEETVGDIDEQRRREMRAERMAAIREECAKAINFPQSPLSQNMHARLDKSMKTSMANGGLLLS